MKSIKRLYACHLFSQGQYDRALEYFLELGSDPLEIIGLYPNLLPRDVRMRYSYPMEIPELAGPGLEKALQALSKYIIHIRGKYCQGTPPTGFDTLDYSNVTDTATIIDTSLLKAYIKTNDAELIQFLKQPNFCHVKECENVLQNYKKYSELVLLYKGKALHRNALELLAK